MCSNCAATDSLWALPCYRFLQIVEVALFRTRTNSTMWTKLELGLDDLITSRVNRWVLAEDKTLAMTQGRGTILRLQVRKFDTSNLDFHNLSEAEKNTYENLWGLTDLRQAEVDVRKFIRESIRPYIYSKTNTDEVISGSFFAAVACYTRLNTTAVCSVQKLWSAPHVLTRPSQKSSVSRELLSTFGQPLE